MKLAVWGLWSGSWGRALRPHGDIVDNVFRDGQLLVQRWIAQTLV